MRLPHTTDLKGVDAALVGVPFDTGSTFRVGARFGPAAIRDASILLRPYNPSLDVDLSQLCSICDYGDLDVVPGFTEDSYSLIAAGLGKVLDAGAVPVLLGGDHSVTLPELRALHRIHGKVALLHLDAHSDTWDQYFGHPYTHGTPFRRAVEEGLVNPFGSVQAGLRGPLYGKNDLQEARDLGYTLVTCREMQEKGIPWTVQVIREKIGTQKVFCSFDLDVVDPAYAPGTSVPEPGGLSSGEALELIRGFGGLNFVGFDVVECLPPYDPTGITSLLAAHVAYEFLSLTAVGRGESF
ncbi:MAG: agmatinase [Armatimonadetes bacterium]|nr:agmatinase [Armatimonadota bacterium]